MLGSNDLSLLLRVLFGHDVCCAEIASLFTKDFAFIAMGLARFFLAPKTWAEILQFRLYSRLLIIYIIALIIVRIARIRSVVLIVLIVLSRGVAVLLCPALLVGSRRLLQLRAVRAALLGRDGRDLFGTQQQQIARDLSLACNVRAATLHHIEPGPQQLHAICLGQCVPVQCLRAQLRHCTLALGASAVTELKVQPRQPQLQHAARGARLSREHFTSPFNLPQHVLEEARVFNGNQGTRRGQFGLAQQLGVQGRALGLYFVG